MRRTIARMQLSLPSGTMSNQTFPHRNSSEMQSLPSSNNKRASRVVSVRKSIDGSYDKQSYLFLIADAKFTSRVKNIPLPHSTALCRIFEQAFLRRAAQQIPCCKKIHTVMGCNISDQASVVVSSPGGTFCNATHCFEVLEK